MSGTTGKLRTTGHYRNQPGHNPVTDRAASDNTLISVVFLAMVLIKGLVIFAIIEASILASMAIILLMSSPPVKP